MRIHRLLRYMIPSNSCLNCACVSSLIPCCVAWSSPSVLVCQEEKDCLDSDSLGSKENLKNLVILLSFHFRGLFAMRTERCQQRVGMMNQGHPMIVVVTMEAWMWQKRQTPIHSTAGDLVQASEDAPPSKKRKRLFQRSWLAGRESWLRYDEERCAMSGTSMDK